MRCASIVTSASGSKRAPEYGHYVTSTRTRWSGFDRLTVAGARVILATGEAPRALDVHLAENCRAKGEPMNRPQSGWRSLIALTTVTACLWATGSAEAQSFRDLPPGSPFKARVLRGGEVMDLSGRTL